MTLLNILKGWPLANNDRAIEYIKLAKGWPPPTLAPTRNILLLSFPLSSPTPF